MRSLLARPRPRCPSVPCFGNSKFCGWETGVVLSCIKDARVHVYFLWQFELSSCVPTISSYAVLSIMAVTRPFPSRLNPLCSTIISTVLHYPPIFRHGNPPRWWFHVALPPSGVAPVPNAAYSPSFFPAVWHPPLERLARAVWFDQWLYGGNGMLRLFWDCGCAQSL